MIKERGCFLEEVSAYKMEKEKLEKMFFEKQLALKAITQFLADRENSSVCLGMKKTLVMKTNKELLSCSSPTTTSTAQSMVR